MKPFILNFYKPAGISSYDVIRSVKRAYKKSLGKIGHFGTLDPFAEGVLIVALGKATKLNDHVHAFLPKTYLAKGILGKETETGDLTIDEIEIDDSDNFHQKIGSFEKSYIESEIKEKFIGEYWQAPHKYSAAKFKGKKLHEWAREGIEIKKEQKKREVYELDVASFEFPKLSLRCKVSTGTYVRTLFTDSAHHLGTLGVLEYLIRESIGGIHMNESIKKENWPQDLKWDLDHFKTDVDVMLPFEQISFSEFQFKLISNGQKLNLEKHQIVFPKSDFSNKYFWGYYGEDLIGLVKISGDELVMDVNFFQ